MRKILLLSAVSIAALTACQPKHTETKTAVYFDRSGMDTTVNPADDFFDYTNGNFVKHAHIPDDLSSWGSFDSLAQDNIKKLHSIAEDAAAKKDAAKGSLEQKVGDFYTSGMDTVTIEKKGYEPLKPFLTKLDAVKDYKELITLLADAAKDGGNGGLLDIDVSADQANSAVNIVNLSQTGLSLPEKDFYTRQDSVSKEQRAALVRHIAKYFEMTGTDAATAAKQASDILALETMIARSHRSAVELRDPIRNYNKMSVAALEKLSPNIGWSATLARLGAKADSVNVGQPEFFKAFSTLLASQPIDVWKNKVKYDYIQSKAGLLSKAFRDENFKFYQIFTGEKNQQERWKIVVQNTDSRLKDVLGQLYVAKYFPPEAKKRMEELVGNLQKAFRARIAKLEWMSDSTKLRAEAKLDIVLKKIGYPTKWKSYDDVDISRDDYFGNTIRLSKHHYNEIIAKVGKPVDRTEWDMTPPTVNAYYNPSYNEIVFPAGILQFPFFDVNADDAINYGGIGMVIGHEMTHGFDDQGRLYDAQGNLKDWWQKSDSVHFADNAKKLSKQYSTYTVLDTMHVNGELTLGENIADLGGVLIAYDAFKLTAEGKDTTKIDGFTPDQRFFLGFAQVWRGVMRPELVRLLVNTNPHSPEIYRVNGTLSNVPAFYTAWHVTDRNKMYHSPDELVRIW
jgi:putative endopeptidase